MTLRGWDPPTAPPVPPGPTPPRRVGLRLAIVTLVVVGVLALVGGVVAFYRFANVDHLGILDSPAVLDVADPACARMAASVRDARPSPEAPAATVAAAMRTQDAAVLAMVAAVRALGPDRLADDHPALLWLADWQTLVELREGYAAALLRGEQPTLTVPRVDGVPITTRMDDVGLSSSCAVADELAHPRAAAR